MSFMFNVGRSIGSGAASIVHGTGIASTQLVAGTKTGYAARALELQAKREALGLSNTTPVEVVDTPKASKAKAPVGRRTARA